MPEFVWADWDSKKRKSRNCASESNSTDDDWASTSSSAPKNKKRKFEPDFTSAASEEDADSEDLHLLGSDLFEQTTTGEPGRERVERARLHEKNGIADTKTPMNFEGASTRNVEVNWDDANDRDKEPLGAIDMSLRSCMQTVLRELREARSRLFQWMQQEVRNILYERSSSLATRMSFAVQNGGATGFEKRGSQLGGVASSGLGTGATGLQFGRHGNVPGFAAQKSDRACFGGHHNRGGGVESNFGFICPAGVSEDVTLGRQTIGGYEGRGMGATHGGQKNAHGDLGFGLGRTREPVPELQRRETGGLDVGLQNSRVAVTGLGGHSGGGDVVISPVQHELRGDAGLGVQAGSRGGICYGGQSHAGSAMVFRRQGGERRVADIRSSTGLGNAAILNNPVGSNQGTSLRMPNETPNLMGMQNPCTNGMQNPMSLNMVWNMMQESGRNGSHGMPDSTVPNFIHDARGKLLSKRMGMHRGMTGSSLGAESSVGVMTSTVMENANAASVMQLPLSMQSASSPLNSSSMPALLGMQSHVAMQNDSSIQNFLGLSMNGGPSINMQGFPAMHLQDNAHHSMAASKGTRKIPSSSVVPSGKVTQITAPRSIPTAHKRGNVMQGMDNLELNT